MISELLKLTKEEEEGVLKEQQSDPKSKNKETGGV